MGGGGPDSSSRTVTVVWDWASVTLGGKGGQRKPPSARMTMYWACSPVRRTSLISIMRKASFPAHTTLPHASLREAVLGQRKEGTSAPEKQAGPARELCRGHQVSRGTS